MSTIRKPSLVRSASTMPIQTGPTLWLSGGGQDKVKVEGTTKFEMGNPDLTFVFEHC